MSDQIEIFDETRPCDCWLNVGKCRCAQNRMSDTERIMSTAGLVNPYESYFEQEKTKFEQIKRDAELQTKLEILNAKHKTMNTYSNQKNDDWWLWAAILISMLIAMS